MWVLGVCTDHDHHHINWALPVRVDAAEDFLKLIKGGARGGQIGPAAMDHLSVGRELTVTHLNIFAHHHYTMFRLMSETCRHQKIHTTPSLFPVAPNTSLLHIYDSKLLDCKPLLVCTAYSEIGFTSMNCFLLNFWSCCNLHPDTHVGMGSHSHWGQRGWLLASSLYLGTGPPVQVCRWLHFTHNFWLVAINVNLHYRGPS